jgi:dsDNA-specific endonuclease/ATPase MutS2
VSGVDDDHADVDAVVVEVVIDGVLDLHHFSPKDLRTLVPDYLDACVAKGIAAVRLIHGRGIGNVQRSVHALLRRHPRVKAFRLADVDAGGRGATVVDLDVTPSAGA